MGTIESEIQSRITKLSYDQKNIFIFFQRRVIKMTITMHVLFYLWLCIIPCHSSTLLFSPTFNEPDHPKAAYDSYPFQVRL